MTVELEQAKEAIRRCRELREAGAVEAALRSEIQSRLRLIFPAIEDHSWLDHYSAGTEAHTQVRTATGNQVHRFIDNLVGSTTIEYEADLRNSAKRREGFAQVHEHVAGLVRAGVPISQVRGILSDTVDWYAYDAVLANDVLPAACSVDDISLSLVDELRLPADDDISAEKLCTFLRKHLAREQSRPLRASFLTSDLGLNSGTHSRCEGPLLELVNNGRAADSAIALATDLWSEFVDYLERAKGGFRASAYADEVYLCVLARLLSANILSEHAILSDDQGLKEILSGSYFQTRYRLENMVERDYFGWTTNQQHIEKLVPIAREIQLDLYAYDFSVRAEEDLFGRLMAQLARRSQRKLLGQEWTPAWLARLLAEHALTNLPGGQMPRLIDMCCGSGSILAEVLKVAREQLSLEDINDLQDVITGFDIDPLAVTLAKTTWVVTLSQEIKNATDVIVIPVYHADSLFAVTPVSAKLPLLGENDAIGVTLDGAVIDLPQALLQPQFRDLFDRIIAWAYDEACEAQVAGETTELTKADTATFLSGAAAAANTELPGDLQSALIPALHSLATRMVELAIANRNGIWAFILRNTYRPALLTGQFNGLVSNPPWLAMSGLADNPYREMLRERAALYGIQPKSQSFLHLELGTTHLLHAIDRYLAPGASVACLVPGTILNGNHHEPLRQRSFLTARRQVPFEISEIWQVEPGTFKYPGAAILGHKRDDAGEVHDTTIVGQHARESGLENADFSVRALGGERTAWVLEKEGLPITSSGMAELPEQGADLMPRTAVCVEVRSETGAEFLVDTPEVGSPWGFTIKAAKELKGERFPGYAPPEFIYHIAQSENLLPFLLGPHRAPIAIPAIRNEEGTWEVLTDASVRRMGFIQSARRFRDINQKLAAIGKGKSLQERIDERGKLTKQNFPDEGHLIVVGAGGKHICAACLPVSDARRLAIDQTLYWKVVSSAEEAWFMVGMLNSHAMTEAILPFNPKGAFSERHIHTLPYRIMPRFDDALDDHMRVAALAQKLATIAAGIVSADDYLGNPNRTLASRRTRLREILCETPEGVELETLCGAILGTAPLGGESSTIEI